MFNDVLGIFFAFSIVSIIMRVLFTPKKDVAEDGKIVVKEGNAKYLILLPFLFFTIIAIVSYKEGGLIVTVGLLLVALAFLFYYIYLINYRLVYKNNKIYVTRLLKKEQEYDIKEIEKAIIGDGIKIVFKNGKTAKVGLSFLNYIEFEYLVKSMDIQKEVK